MLRRFAFILAACLGAAGPARADLLQFSYTDQTADHVGTVDLVGMTFQFNKLTGAYTIALQASAANPFQGSFRINMNLFNPDAGTAENPGYFSDTLNDFTFAAPSTTVSLTGTNARLTSWDVGDRVAPSSGTFGNPTGPSGIVAFGSGVWTGPLVNISDLLGTSSNSLGAGNGFAVITAVPEPSPLWLAGAAGGAGLALSRARRALRRRAG